MKNVFTFIFLFICLGNLQAQFNRGNQLLTGAFTLSNFNSKTTGMNETNYTKVFGVGIGLGKQWGHKENRIRGFQIGYNYNTNTQNIRGVSGENKRNTTSNSFNVGYVSQYLLPFGKRFFGTATLLTQLAVGREKEKYENFNNSTFSTNGTIYSLDFGIIPGLAYLLTQRWIADVAIGNLVGANVSHRRTSSVSSSTSFNQRSTGFGLNSVFSGSGAFLSIGFRYVLR